MPRVLSNIGGTLLHLGRLQEAGSALRRSIALVPRDLRYRVSAGDAYRLAPGFADLKDKSEFQKLTTPTPAAR